MAGFRELLAVEWNDNAVATFKLNFPEVPVYHGDIHKLTVEQCLQMAGLQPGELDILDGSPPCQGFSTAGKRVMEDKRNQLYMEFVRLLRGLRPKVFVMENVSGLVKGKMKLVFADIMQELKASGYKVRCKLLNAMYFQVPQSRQRLIFIGVREDLGVEASYPKAQGRPLTLEKAWDKVGIPEAESCIGRFAIGQEWRRLLPGQKSKRYLSLTRARLDRPSPTLTKMAGETLSAAAVTHPQECRKYSLREAARVGSFPDSFEFLGWADGLFHIGNSVPPLFMEAIVEHIRTEILERMELEPKLVES